MSIFQEKLSKVVGEIRFRPTLSSTDGLMSVGKIIESEFPHWKSQAGQNVVLFNDETKNLVQIKYNSVLFVNEGGEENKALFDFVKKVYEKLVVDFDVTEIQHIGCRRQKVYQTKFGFTDLVDLTFNKLYGNIEVLKNISGKIIRDTLFVLDATKDGLGTHIQLGPSQVVQAEDFFKSQFDRTPLDVDKNYLIADIDVYKKEGLSKENGVRDLELIINSNNEILSSYLEFLSTK